jgi:hypothetical protein
MVFKKKQKNLIPSQIFSVCLDISYNEPYLFCINLKEFTYYVVYSKTEKLYMIDILYVF